MEVPYHKSLERPAFLEPIHFHFFLERSIMTSQNKFEDVQPKRFRGPRKGEEFTKINWTTSGAVLIHHFLALWGLWQIARGEAAWQTLIFASILVAVGCLGTTLGAHRLWAHKCYQATLPLKIMLMFWQTLAGQRSIWRWSAWHRVHHKFTDTPADPHNASRGFWYSHVGWLMLYDHEIFLQHQKKVVMKDLDSDGVVMWQKRNYSWLYPLVAFVLPTLIPWYFWKESLLSAFLISGNARYVFTCHQTWCINSVAHLWGSKPYDKSIQPVENPFASIVAFGEGWHNYHHVFPWDYKASELGFTKFNVSTTLIHFFAWLGWAYDLKSVSKEMLEQRKMRTGEWPTLAHAMQ